MLKRILLVCAVTMGVVFSAASMAESSAAIGVVDMDGIFKDSPQAKAISDSLKKQFAGRQSDLEKMQKDYEADVSKLTKNKSVMSDSDTKDLQDKISSEQGELRQAQAKFQQEVYTARNKQVTAFYAKVKTVVATIAAKDKLNVVLPKTTVLYSEDSMDITKDVLAAL